MNTSMGPDQWRVLPQVFLYTKLFNVGTYKLFKELQLFAFQSSKR